MLPKMQRFEQNYWNATTSEVTEGDKFRAGPNAHIKAGTHFQPPIVIGKSGFIDGGVALGRYTAIGAFSKAANVQMGSFCSVGQWCNLNHLGYHPTGWLSTHRFQTPQGQAQFDFDEAMRAVRTLSCNDTYGRLTIGHDVWIGDDVHVLGGVTIGHGAIIGAKSFVNSNIPHYAIAAGIPARVKKYRFPPDIIKKLLELQWWELALQDVGHLQFNDIVTAIAQLEAIREKNPLASSPT
jgi:acetyltransferase-like isoleucine patch superfamily enzyme